jgi:hypothetical protein
MALCKIVHAYSAKPRNKTHLILQTLASPSLAAPVAVSTPHPNLEKYVFELTVVASTSAAGRKVEIKQMVDGNDHTYLSISGGSTG